MLLSSNIRILKQERQLSFNFNRIYLNYCGLSRLDAAREEKVDAAFERVIQCVLAESGDSSRRLKIKLGVAYGVGLVKDLDLQGGHGDVTLLSRKLGIGNRFAKKILCSALNGTVEQLLQRRKSPASSFQSSEWPERFKEYVFRPEFARSTPGVVTSNLSNPNKCKTF